MIAAALLVLTLGGTVLVVGGVWTVLQFVSQAWSRHDVQGVARSAEYRIDRVVQDAFGQMLDEARRHRQG